MRRHFQRPFTLPDAATEVVLVRHGAVSRASPDALVGGHSDPQLSSRGRRQAAALVGRLASEPIAALFVTPLGRTAATAAPLAAALGLEPVVVAELREVHLGEWEGPQFQERMSAGDPLSVRILDEERWDIVPGAEPADAFARRIAEGLEAVVRCTGPDRVAAAVVHGGVIAEACRQATGSRPFAFLGAENGSVTRLVRLEDGRWLLRCFNGTTHLAAV
jgi:probable phosphoglycerate mutase